MLGHVMWQTSADWRLSSGCLSLQWPEKYTRALHHSRSLESFWLRRHSRQQQYWILQELGGSEEALLADAVS